MARISPPSSTTANRTSRRVVATLAALALALGLAACAKPAAAVTSLMIGASVEPKTLDITASDDAAIPQLLLYNVYETLVKIDGSGQIVPLLAESYEVSADNLTYTFRLDPAAKFASGAPVDAAAVVASAGRLRLASNAVIATPLSQVATVVALDSQTVAYTLTAPSNSWLYQIASSAGVVIEPAVDLASQTAGSGPYQVVPGDWLKGDRIMLTKNPGYWGQPAAYDEISFRYISDPNVMTAAMLSGELDIISNLTTPSSLDVFADTSRYTVLEGTSAGEVVLGFNHAKPALQDLKVRQAINYAIDRQGLVDTVWGGKGRLIGTMTVPTDPYYEDLSGLYPYDPERAKALLAEAAVSDLTLALRVATDLPYAPPAAQYISSQLAAVGITAQVEEISWSRWLDEVFVAGDYDLTIVAHVEPRDIAMFANPDYYWHYNNPAFAELIAAADRGSAADYIADTKAAARLLAEDAAADWLFLLPNLVITRAGISGLAANATSLSFDLTTIRE